jgi:hypothetical protein
VHGHGRSDLGGVVGLAVAHGHGPRWLDDTAASTAGLGTGDVMALSPRVVVVHRHTEMEQVVAGSGTPGQARFRAASRGRSLGEVEQGHSAQQDAMQQVAAAIPPDWRRGEVERADLDRFVFGAEDIVVAVGQDGLVANVAKYLDGQPVVGINPEPERNPGVLVRHPPKDIAGLLDVAVAPVARRPVEARTMVEARTDDGQVLRALNEVYVGHATHQSARYQIEPPRAGPERQSSSGILVGTGTGATGWCASVWRMRGSDLELPAPGESRLCWFVREAWPSPATGTDQVEGALAGEDTLGIVAESDLVVFGDGMERDALALTWGQRVRVGVAPRQLQLVVP